jgi:hypothetical protein
LCTGQYGEVWLHLGTALMEVPQTLNVSNENTTLTTGWYGVLLLWEVRQYMKHVLITRLYDLSH